MNYLITGTALGLLSETSDDFHRLTGDAPQDMAEFLKANYQASK